MHRCASPSAVRWSGSPAQSRGTGVAVNWDQVLARRHAATSTAPMTAAASAIRRPVRPDVVVKIIAPAVGYGAVGSTPIRRSAGRRRR